MRRIFGYLLISFLSSCAGVSDRNDYVELDSLDIVVVYQDSIQDEVILPILKEVENDSIALQLVPVIKEFVSDTSYYAIIRENDMDTTCDHVKWNQIQIDQQLTEINVLLDSLVKRPKLK